MTKKTARTYTIFAGDKIKTYRDMYFEVSRVDVETKQVYGITYYWNTFSNEYKPWNSREETHFGPVLISYMNGRDRSYAYRDFHSLDPT